MTYHSLLHDIQLTLKRTLVTKIVSSHLISLPVTFPLVTHVGFDPIWFGVLSVMMVCMGLVFPPVGLVAFVVSATTHVKLVTVYRGTIILIFAIFLSFILVMIFPQIALWLPATMR